MEAEEFSEYVELLGDEPLAQGDVIRAIGNGGDLWLGLLIVVTADCDLAHHKHGGTISCVPVLEASEYANLFLIAPDMLRIKDRLVERLSGEFHAAQAAASGDEQYTPLTPKRVAEWVSEADDETIQRTFTELNLAKATPLIAALRQIADPAAVTHAQSLEVLAAAKHAVGDHKSLLEAQKSIHKNFTSQFSKLPGDAMFLHRLAVDLNEGYVAYLRRIVDVQETNVAVNVPEMEAGRGYERVARLTSPYIYGLTQKLANVFSSIGLPDEYELARRKYISNMVQTPGVVQ